jgi:hypothetical protein
VLSSARRTEKVSVCADWGGFEFRVWYEGRGDLVGFRGNCGVKLE